MDPDKAFAAPELLPASPTNLVSSLLSMVSDCPIVASVLANKSSTACCELFKAFTSTSDVILPSAATERSCPIVMPIPCAIALASPGVCSMTELSSSPRKVPDAKAWLNWTKAASALAALAPLIATALETVSVRRAVSCMFKPRVLALFAKPW